MNGFILSVNSIQSLQIMVQTKLSLFTFYTLCHGSKLIATGLQINVQCEVDG